MVNEIRNWRNLSEKNLQKIVETLILIENDKETMYYIWEIVCSSECPLNIKLRFGYLLLSGIVKYEYPFSINELIDGFKLNDDAALSIINGIIDCKPQSNIFPLNIKTESFDKLKLIFVLFDKLYNNKCKEYYHMIVLSKRVWEMFERQYRENATLPSFVEIKKLIRYFVPLLDSNINGVPVLLCNLFIAIIRWAHETNTKEILNNFFINDLLIEFFPGVTTDILSYPLSKIHIRYLKIVIRAIGPEIVLIKLPLLFEYLLHSISINYTASVSGDALSACLKCLTDVDSVAKEHLVAVLEQYVTHGCDKLWFTEGSIELHQLNVAQFTLPTFANCYRKEVNVINNSLLTILRDGDCCLLRDHRLFMWICLFSLADDQDRIITNEESENLLKCLSHSNDHIRITAYTFVCDNYTHRFSQSTSINLAVILDVCAKNLTSDNPSFRNHFIAVTKRLFVSVRDTVIPFFVNPQTLISDIDNGMKNTLFDNESVRYLESVSWIDIRNKMHGIIHKDIALFLIFCRYIYCNQWYHPSMNYQRQKSMAELIRSIREVIVDPNFFIDKKSGFSQKTVNIMREFYQKCFGKYFNKKHIISNFIDSLQISKSDIQKGFYNLLIQTYNDSQCFTEDNIDLNKLWTLAQVLCNSNQPTQLSSGSFIVAFLSQCYYIPSSYTSISDYLLCVLEDFTRLNMTSVLHIALNQPGHGYMIALELLLRESNNDNVLKSDRVCIAAIEVIKIMMKIMGCDQEEMASFHKIGITITSMASSGNTNISSKSIEMLAEYQHVLSWSWQILRMSATILVNWCRIVDKERDSELFYEVGVILLRIMFQSRHRGTIESVSNCLQNYIQLGEKSIHKKSWITARKVAIDECIDGAVRGNHSITRRSAGLPLVLMAALSDSTEGRVLARESLFQLFSLSRNNIEAANCQDLCDPQIVHYLNLIRNLCQHPGLVAILQRYYGEVVLISLENFSSSHWGVRNAALQLFTSIVCRLAALTRVNPTFGELFSIYPELWCPLLTIVQNGSQVSKSFHKHKTLVPALTFLANIQYCHDNFLPDSMIIGDLRRHLWPLLGSEVMAVRQLAVKCIVRTLPSSIFSLEIIKSNTELIPVILSSSASSVLFDESISKVTSSAQHGELLLLKTFLKSINLRDIHLAIREYCEILITNKCWVILETVVSILLDMELKGDDKITIARFFNENLLRLLRESPSVGEIGRQEVIITLMKLVVRLDVDLAAGITKHVLRVSNSDILQNLSLESAFIPNLFSNNFSVLFDSLCDSLQNYQAHYSPYICQIFVTTLKDNKNIRETLNLYGVKNLLIKTLKSRIPETVMVSCMEIFTFMLMHSDKIVETEAVFWIEQLEKSLDAHVPENNREAAVNNLAAVVECTNSDKVISLVTSRIAALYTVGCYDECRKIRELFRASLLKIIDCNPDKTPSSSDLMEFYRNICNRSSVSLPIVALSIWEHIVTAQCHFHREVMECRKKDALYEPVPTNIYIEDAFILDNLYETLKNERSLCRKSILKIIDLHVVDIDFNNCASDCSAFILKTSLKLLNNLL